MDLAQVTLSQMRYAVSVAEARNFRLAAAQCHVSQSGLSMQVQKLEELLGITLFDRGKKPVLPTREGESALVQMRRVLKETERLGQIVAEEDEPSGPFRLGVIPTLSPTVLPLFLADFIASYPRVELLIEELQTEEVISRLHADTLDAAIAATPLDVTGLKETSLGREALLAYLPPESALLRKKTVTQRDLLPLNVWVMPEGHCFRSQVLSYCQAKRQSVQGHVHFESGSFETLIRLVDAGMGATVLPALVVDGLSQARRRAQVRPFAAPTPVREIGLVTARSELRRRVTTALVELVRSRLEAVLGETPKRVQVLAPTD